MTLTKFGDYQILNKIATGGMAEIFLAKHVNSPPNSLPIAIKKVIKKFSRHRSFIKMFLSEARIICNIKHENIVRIYDFGKEEGQYYLAMEYVFGQNLGELYNKLVSKNGKLPLHIVLEIALSVLSGLDHAHNTKDRNGIFLNIVHLDMNPNNILLSYDNKVKIVDFGIAHAAYSEILKNNLESIQGTYGYLSPEQCKEEQVDRRSDIFSFGVILHELLTMEPLFKHLENDAAILHAILNNEIKPPHEINPAVPEELSRITMKSLARNKEDRYQSASEMYEDVKGYQNTMEFNPEADALPKILKKNFPAHFIRMNKILERARTDYLLDELFDDIEEIEEINLEEKIRMKSHEKENKVQPKNKNKSSVGRFAVITTFIAVIAAAVYFFMTSIKPEIKDISIFSDPPGASIYINGENTGRKTPAVINMVEGEMYIIELRKNSFTGGMQFRPDKTNNEINIKLKEPHND